MVSFFAVPWHGMNGHHNVTTWDGHSDGYGWLWSFRSPEVIPYGPDGMKIYQSESHDGRITNVPCYPCCDQSSNLAMYPWDHLDELNAGHQNLKAGQENGLKWDASRKFFRTIGLIQVYPLLHHDFPPISMANFNGHSMVDGFALSFLKSAHLMESCYPSGPCKSCCAFEKRTDANSTQCDPFQPVVKVLISVCVCIYI